VIRGKKSSIKYNILKIFGNILQFPSENVIGEKNCQNRIVFLDVRKGFLISFIKPFWGKKKSKNF